MDNIKDEQLKKILSELAENLIHVYGKQLKEVILYGSVARGVPSKESDIDIMVLVDADDKVLRDYSEKLSDVSADISIKYLRVFSIIDISYQEYLNWKQVLPYYRNISEEGIILYAA